MTESIRNHRYDHLALVSMEVVPPDDEPDEVADLGDDDRRALTLTDLH